MTKLSTVIFSLSSSNIRNANGVFAGTVEKSKEQKKITRVANRYSKTKRESMKSGPCVVVFSQNK